MELYGNSVLNNTLHDRLDRHKLQKSQSAVWTRNNEVGVKYIIDIGD